MSLFGRSPLKTGQVVAARYRIEPEPVRGGTFGLTYKAHDLRTHRMIALKEYYPVREGRRAEGELTLELARSAQDRLSDFEKETASLERTPRHPGIAAFAGADRAHGTGYLALEWIDGGTLDDQPAADDGLITSWFLQLIDAVLHLAHVHLAHRDIKPQNIMIRSDGTAVLVDLGAARLVSGGATFDRRTNILTPAYAPPELFTQGGYQGVWSDIFGVCAAFYDILSGQQPVKLREAFDGCRRFEDTSTPLVSLKQFGFARLEDRSNRLLEAIDIGLVADIQARPRGARRFLGSLGIEAEQLSDYLPAEYLAKTRLLEPDAELRHQITPSHKPQNDRPKASFERHQTALIQSLDPARFQRSAFVSVGGETYDNTHEQKIALARTEVFLNLMFGREIVVPAGHIADSEAVFAVLGEILGPYVDDYRAKIDASFAEAGLPRWRPFRLALEDRTNEDGYPGFVARYRYTGAPLPLLQAAGRLDRTDEEAMKAVGVDHLKRLFLSRDFSGLEAMVKRDGYGTYAARVLQYFTPETSLFSIRPDAVESLARYAEVFYRHLDNEYVSGAGVAEAKEKLGSVDKIKADLRQLVEHGVDGATGFRGNWYVYDGEFGDVWPLARAYLDAKLYLTLANQYGIDHPVLVSQALEYGRFDHSLVLGPRFGQSMSEEPKMDDGLKRLSLAFSRSCPWRDVLEMYLNDRFQFSLVELNNCYRSGDRRRYSFAVERHAQTVANLIGDVTVDLNNGRVLLGRSGVPDSTMAVDSYDAPLEAVQHAARLAEVGASVLPGFAAEGYDAASVGLLPLRHDLEDLAKGKATLMHYFIKPFVMKLHR